ncbi:hypothetical protein [Clostridium tagluense]|uniref:Uncharacterized protein n=1 Tax=Clostridium tagluense TaxID=360422 RepID=A0A401UUJ6_9CLOT|nr:hypothetical protein [Clostridium tagluense]GCD13174.1 hypothetical protein Ctaglu_47970 [Clostridium tagluense]
MAQKRMFSLKIIDTDLFLDMPVSSQLLYFQLNMRADDDGFVSSPQKIIKMVNCSSDDLKILTAKKFIIPFESGICVIRHWRIHNYIQNDRYQATLYNNEKANIENDNGTYNLMDTKCVQDGYILDTQVSVDKVSVDKFSVDKVILDEQQPENSNINKLQIVIDSWNSLNLTKVINIKGNRLLLLNTRIKDYGLEKTLQAIESIKQSKFLKGQNKESWIITFDWFVKPNNFIKVLEGNYIDKFTQNKEVTDETNIGNSTLYTNKKF